MKWRAFATDFDGTIATDGTVDEITRAALRRIRQGVELTLLVTGRVLSDFDGSDVPEFFDVVVAENGAVLYSPGSKVARALAVPPPAAFAEELARRGVPVGRGEVIVATIEPHEVTVLELIKEMALELQVIFNKGAVMILPAGVNKASGLRAAIEPRGIEMSEIVAVGDAENDNAFLEGCGLSVAVANALPALKAQVDYVTQSNAGAGVTELIEILLRGGLDAASQRATL